MAMSKPEVLTSQAVNKIEMQFRRLNLGFRGRIDERNTDRHRNMHAECRNPHGDVETGNIYKLG